MDNDDHDNIGDNEENNSDNDNNDVETTIMKYINDLSSGLWRWSLYVINAMFRLDTWLSNKKQFLNWWRKSTHSI